MKGPMAHEETHEEEHEESHKGTQPQMKRRMTQLEESLDIWPLSAWSGLLYTRRRASLLYTPVC
jgi:hypothetical protein